MKKAYVLSGVLIVTLASVWHASLQAATPPLDPSIINKYTSPNQIDPNHPIETYSVGLNGGETQNDVLNHLPTTVYPEDKVSFLIDPALGVGTMVRVQRALPITIIDGSTQITTRTWDTSVGQLLDDLHRPLVDLDRANYVSTDPLAQNMTITITRVSQVTITQTEPIPFTTITKNDPTLDRPQTKVKEPGGNGIKTDTYQITRQDGEEVSRQLIKSQVTLKPKDKIVLQGTKVEVGKTQTARATWYDLCCTQVASNSFSKGTTLRLTNLSDGKQIQVKVEDTGSFDSTKTVVDLSPTLFQQLGGNLSAGTIPKVKAEQILNP